MHRKYNIRDPFYFSSHKFILDFPAQKTKIPATQQTNKITQRSSSIIFLLDLSQAQKKTVPLLGVEPKICGLEVRSFIH